jgi:drug/metabolite transporter (DMT)-like permease
VAGATSASLVTLLVPPAAILLGIAFLGETLSLTEALGLGLIALGLLSLDNRLAIKRQRQAQRPPGAGGENGKWGKTG